MNNQGKKELARFQKGMIISVIGFATTFGGMCAGSMALIIAGMIVQFISSFVCDTFSVASKMLKNIAIVLNLLPGFGFSFIMVLMDYCLLGSLMVAFSPLANFVMYLLQGRIGECKDEKESFDNITVNESYYNQQVVPEYIYYNQQQAAPNYGYYNQQQAAPNYGYYNQQQAAPGYSYYNQQ